jgi:pimeloyl-ACP methyl ester carboxylesterase
MRPMGSDLIAELGGGTALGYTEMGEPNGFPVVHLHGNPGSRLEVKLPAFRRAAEANGVRLIGVDRPGIGLSTFHPFSLAEFPDLLLRFADALGLPEFAVTGVSGGGKYACACAALLPERVRRVILVSTTCSRDLPGAKATPNRVDRMLYPVAARAPWMIRPIFAKMARTARKDPDSLIRMLDDLGPADQDLLADADFREGLTTSVAEAFRQGGRGLVQDYVIEARPWDLALGSIAVPVDLWHGEDDRVVSADASRILAAELPTATTHLQPDAGHLMLSSYADTILRTAAAKPTRSP